MNKKYLPGELALCVVLIINSLGVCLMAKSGFGISTISSVPFVFNKVFPSLSFGTWNYIFQTLLVLSLMILKKAFCFEYIFSFVVGIGFGKMIDVHDAWLAFLPNTMALNVLYFALEIRKKYVAVRHTNVFKPHILKIHLFYCNFALYSFSS